MHEASVILDELIAVAEQAGCGSVYNEVAEIGFDVTDVEDASDIIQQLFEFTNKLQLSEWKNVEEIPHFFHFIFCAICLLTNRMFHDIIERAAHERGGPKFVK